MCACHKNGLGKFWLLSLVVAAFGATSMLSSAWAQQPPNNNPNVNTNIGTFVNIVGGVSVSVDGVLNQLDQTRQAELRAARQQALQQVPGDLNQPADLRMVSLRKLDEAIGEHFKAGKPLPDEIKYLAGLQRVQYVFVYPEENDVVLAGPAEGWEINAAGNVVGNVSGRPVMQLDDLLVALRYADAARNGGMTVSIDPTPEGIQRLNALLANQRTIGSNPQATIAAMEEAMGPQTITIQGVPTNSRFASVMVVADYRMKRLAMNFDKSPVKGLVSYLQMVGNGVKGMQTPRWWLAPRYEPIATDGEGLAWEIRGQGVQAMAEEDHFNAAGQREKRLKANPVAQKWADSMTKHYDELAAKDSVFGDLRNCMDLAVVGALAVKEQLFEKVNLRPTYLLNADALPLTHYMAPKQVDTKASFIKKGSNYTISASGGVALQPWDVTTKSEVSKTIAPVRTAAAKERNGNWWWN